MKKIKFYKKQKAKFILKMLKIKIFRLIIKINHKLFIIKTNNQKINY